MGALRILLVGRHEDAGPALAGLLERAGHAVRRVGRLADAPAACDDDGPFDLVVSPVDGPGPGALAEMRDVARRCGAAGVAVSGITVDGGLAGAAVEDEPGAADGVLPRVWEDVVDVLREMRSAVDGFNQVGP